MTDNVLLLQGPMGPFFKRFSQDLESAGHAVYKINFNAADCFFFRGKNTTSYTDSIDHWADFLKQYIDRHAIDIIYLFGDARPYHKIAHEVARNLSVTVYVFEEGYIRPNYITLERDGVNGHSSTPEDPEAYRDIEIKSEDDIEQVPYTFFHTSMYAMLYFAIGWLGRRNFPNYIHHRPFDALREAGIWLKSGFRKLKYRYLERKILHRLTTRHSKKFYLVPLQVHNDAQIVVWSSVSSTASFIKQVITSFAHHADKKHILVIKHHPLDRGYVDYTKMINKLAGMLKCEDRVLYVHDLHLPTLLDHARGTVVVNSTVGLSSLLHNTPVKTFGKAIYNIKGLTFQGSLKDFWYNTGRVNTKLNLKLRTHLVENTQVNGNFYRRTKAFESHSGIDMQHLSENILKPKTADQKPEIPLPAPTIATPERVLPNVETEIASNA